MNKLTGGLLFLLPLTLRYIDLQYSGAVVCGVLRPSLRCRKDTISESTERFELLQMDG